MQWDPICHVRMDVKRSSYLNLLDDLTEGRTVPHTVLAGDPHLLRAPTLRSPAVVIVAFYG